MRTSQPLPNGTETTPFQQLVENASDTILVLDAEGQRPKELIGESYGQAVATEIQIPHPTVHDFEQTGLLMTAAPISGPAARHYPLMAFDFRLDELWNTGYTY